MSICITCPSCNADMDLDVALAHDELRQAVLDIITAGLPLGRLALRYVNLFKPRKYKMRPARLAKLLGQFSPDILRQAITHNGRDWAVPLPAWEDGFNAMLERAAAGKLTLPLESHGYLYAMLASQSDRAEAAIEEQREEQRRTGPRQPTSNGPQSVADLVHPKPRTMPQQSAGTSPLVRQMRAAARPRHNGETS